MRKEHRAASAAKIVRFSVPMVIRDDIWRSAVFLVFFFYLLGCCEKTVEKKVIFVESVDLIPQRKIYKKNDTIWLRYANVDKKFIDQETGKEVFVQNATFDFPVSYGIKAKHSLPPLIVGSFCDYITSPNVYANRSTSNDASNIIISYGCDLPDDGYAFKLGIIPKISGIFSIATGSAMEVISCPSKNYDLQSSSIEYRFNVIDGNKDVFHSIPFEDRLITFFNGYTESRIDNKKEYVFQVE